MQEWIRQIIIYVILVTVLRGLIMKPQYEQYFRFFSGIVLILLVVSPVLRVLHQDTASENRGNQQGHKGAIATI